MLCGRSRYNKAATVHTATPSRLELRLPDMYYAGVKPGGIRAFRTMSVPFFHPRSSSQSEVLVPLKYSLDYLVDEKIKYVFVKKLLNYLISRIK